MRSWLENTPSATAATSSAAEQPRLPHRARGGRPAGAVAVAVLYNGCRRAGRTGRRSGRSLAPRSASRRTRCARFQGTTVGSRAARLLARRRAARGRAAGARRRARDAAAAPRRAPAPAGHVPHVHSGHLAPATRRPLISTAGGPDGVASSEPTTTPRAARRLRRGGARLTRPSPPSPRGVSTDGLTPPTAMPHDAAVVHLRRRPRWRRMRARRSGKLDPREASSAGPCSMATEMFEHASLRRRAQGLGLGEVECAASRCANSTRPVLFFLCAGARPACRVSRLAHRAAHSARSGCSSSSAGTVRHASTASVPSARIECRVVAGGLRGAAGARAPRPARRPRRPPSSGRARSARRAAAARTRRTRSATHFAAAPAASAAPRSAAAVARATGSSRAGPRPRPRRATRPRRSRARRAARRRCRARRARANSFTRARELTIARGSRTRWTRARLRRAAARGYVGGGGGGLGASRRRRRRGRRRVDEREVDEPDHLGRAVAARHSHRVLRDARGWLAARAPARALDARAACAASAPRTRSSQWRERARTAIATR